MRIMISHPGHAVSTVDVFNGIYQALLKTEHEISFFPYNTHLVFHRVAFDAWRQANPDFNIPPNSFMVCASENIIPQVIDFVPDVVLVICGLTLHRRAYDLLNRLKIPVVLVLTESPYADYIQSQAIQATKAIGALTNDKTSAIPLQEVTKVPVEYLPHSFDPAVHYKRSMKNLSSKYKMNAFFHGTLWPERLALFNRVNGINNYLISGISPALESKRADKANVIPNEEMALYYSGTKIAINHNRTICGVDPKGIHRAEHLSQGDAFSLGPRAYEIAACEAFQLTDDSRGEREEVFGDSVATYADIDDLNKKTGYYLTHENERIDMAKESHARVQDCTFENRVNNIILPFLTEVLNGRTISRN